jgi:phage-related protein
MSLPVFTFCPEFGAREIRAPRTSPFQFGNGKERRYRFGLITDLRTWELTFDYNADAEREEILAFLEERGAWKVFEWTDPKEYFARWRCKEWRTTWNGPRRHVIVCTFLEVDERAAVADGPPADGLADMWVSRVTTPIVGCRDSVNILTSDGGSYQTALIQEEGVIGERDLYVFKRNAAGVVIWQREFQAFHTVFSINAAGPLPPVLVVDKDNNLYVVYGQSGFFGEGSTGNDERVFVFKVNADGTLGWQHKYKRSKPDSSVIGLSPLDAIYNPILDVVVVVARGATGSSAGSANDSSAEISILNLAPASGAVVNQRTLYSLLVNNSGSVQSVSSAIAQIRSGRLFISANQGFTTAIAELSLDLGTLFSTPRLTPVDATYSFPASDGGWYSVCRILKGSSTIYRILKLTSSFVPVWLQSDSNGNIPMGTSAPFNLCQRSIGQNGRIAWCYRSGVQVDFGAAGSSGTFLSTALFDHENALAGERATTLGSGEQITAGAGGGLSLILDSVRSRVTTSSARNTGTNGMKVFAVGARDFYEDGAARYLDAGTSEVSTFFTTVRSQIDGTYFQLQFADILDLPLASAASPETRADVDIIREDGLGRVLQSGFLGIAYYAYSDPEYIAPTQAGAASLVFYAGNNAVQRVSVGKTFAPALLVIANRAASNRKAVFNTFFSKRHYQGWNGTRTAISDSTDVDSLVELAQGNFKIAGRLDSLNKVGENFVAFALSAITGAHEIVSYTGTGAIQTISHSLGATPAFVLFQRDGTGITLAGTALGGTGINYNPGSSTGTVTSSTSYVRAINSSSVEIGTISALNASGDQYRMHVFQSSDDWTIDNVSGPGTGTLTVSLGFQPKAILFKGATGVGTAWQLLYRPDGTTGVAKSLPLNAGSAVEADSTFASITANGFTILQGGPGNTGSSSAFYLAINTTSGQTPGNVQIPSASITVNPLAFTVAGTSSVAMPAVNVTVTALAPIQNNVPIPAVDITVTGLDPVQNNVPIPVVDVTVEALAPTLSP